MKTADVIRAIRPLQRAVAPLLIEDVTNGDMPTSVDEVIDRYADRIGAPFHFDDGKGWKDDIRSAAIWTLMRNGFAKGKVVHLSKDGMLSSWSTVRIELEAAVAIEIEFGGNRALSVRAKEIVAQATVIGEGSRAVYVYTDSRLDRLGDKCTKIGRHDRSGGGEVLRRILSQYSTGNPGHPVLRVIARTDREVGLETFLHRRFGSRRIENGFGAEWFSVPYEEVAIEIETYLALQMSGDH
ncbi:GIY-YIG nuclease family protein [Tabrizicola sp.]|uniref:GIY-YIG nuclease family protein n=1 Tax=Tabrizicola sp. TaxID=2005166 RepID=UPI001A54030B|nr:GIY-YIG nuclease family protein [Tabrizicola sp.]MBL9075441.1 GIY-YIG nuclease family protein [Tabrizicola sp.]